MSHFGGGEGGAAAAAAPARLVRRKRAASFGLVLAALAALLALLALAATFPLLVRSATSALALARIGRAASSTHHQMIGRRVSPYVVTVQNNELHVRGSGVLVADKFVITAGQNVATLDMLTHKTDLITSPANLAVSIRLQWGQALQTRRVIRLWLHTAYSSGVGSAKTVNLAMLELDSAFEKRNASAPDYWQSAVLAKAGEEAEFERHGVSYWSSVFGRIASTREPTHVDGPDYLGETFGDVVLCGNEEEWLQNNSTFCFAGRSHSPPRACSGDAGAPLSVRNSQNIPVVFGVVSSPQSKGCVGDAAPHEWGTAVSIAKLRGWIDGVLSGKPFGASEVSIASAVVKEHPCWTNTDPEGEVFCSPISSFRVLGQGVKMDEWRVKHCSSGRIVNVPKTSISACNKPCQLKRVCTTEQTLENLAERSKPVMCEKGGARAAFRWTGHKKGFSISNSVELEVQSCSGSGVPVWRAANDLEPCPESACLSAIPVDEPKLEVVCDKLGNAALATGRKEGSLKQPSVFVPLWFHERIQVIPCHGGPAQWLLSYATVKCSAGEIKRCRGPEGTPRMVSGSAYAQGASIFTETDEEFEKLDAASDRSDF